MKKNIVIAIRLTFVSMVFFCGIYTFAVWVIAQMVPGQGEGVTIVENGKKYDINVGQSFTSDKYFRSRPSAAGYDATRSGGSNKGPANPGYRIEIQARVDTFLIHNPTIHKSEIPSDLITASGSGLDPDFSVQSAEVQVERIAKVRNISTDKIYKLIKEDTEHPLFGLFGTERINVLKLNLDLDKLK